MKLLLTSNGISNPTLRDSLLRLAGKPATELKIAFIPTAANVLHEDKQWLIDNLLQLKETGFSFIDIVDIAAVTQNMWQSRLEAVDIILVGGGHSPYLCEQMHTSGFAKALPQLLESRVYMGISAGSMALTPRMPRSIEEIVYPEEADEDTEGLGLVDFYLLPHLGSSYFPRVTKENGERVARESNRVVYVLDDDMGTEIDGESMQLVGEGTYFKCEK